MITPIIVPMTVAVAGATIPMSVAATDVPVQANVEVAYYANHYDIYDGPYDFTPAEEAQVIHTENFALEHDIIIEPIPSNWGRISYNGSVITVS